MSSGSKTTPRIQVFRPTMEEFKDFSKYIETIESQGAHKAGLAKIIPPDGWNPRKNGYDDVDIMIPAPISQMVQGRQGLFQQFNIQQKNMTVKAYKNLAENPKFRTPPHFDYEDLERKYWKNISYNPPIYGADVSGSLYDPGVEEFNIQHLNTILDLVKNDYEIQIEGVNTAYLYFGMWKTSFPWHTEDMDLYSINYLHYGAPKSWYAIPPEHGRRLERLAANFFHQSSAECSAFLRHKMTIISPHILKQFSIPYNKITQEPGEFMITFPFGYHSGFNHGYNCAESTNFALPRWVEYGKRASSCTCRNDCVKICMEMFVRKFQPERYEDWKAGRDYGSHPEDPSRHYAAPPPNKFDLARAAQREEKKKARKLEASQKIKRHPISKVEKNTPDYKDQSMTKEEGDDSDTKTEIYDMSDLEKCDDISGNSVSVEEETNVAMDPTQFEMFDDDTIIKKELLLEEDIPLDKRAKKKVAKKKPKEETPKSVKRIKKADSIKPPKKKSTTPKSSKKAAKMTDEKTVVPKVLQDSPPPLIDYSDYVNKHAVVKEERVISITEGLSQLPVEKPSIPETVPQPPAAAAAEVIVVPSSSAAQTNVLNSDMFHNFPSSLQQAISNGTLALTRVPQAITQKPDEISSRVIKLTPGTSEPIIQSAIQNPVNLSPAKSFGSPNIQYMPHEREWKYEQTQGLKCKFVLPKPGVQAATPSVSSNFVLSTLSSMAADPSPGHSQPPPLLRMEMTKPDTTSPGSSIAGSSVANLEPPFLEPPIPVSTVQVEASLPQGAKIKTPKKQKEHRSHGQDSVKAASDCLGNWARPIHALWQHQPFDFEAEKVFNVHCSTVDPHCAICMVFNPAIIQQDYPNPPAAIPPSSKVKMPTFCFGNCLDNQFIDGNPLYSREGTSPILTCDTCRLTVHATCYGITMMHFKSWRCSRCCSISAQQKADCCLCIFRGGALKPTTDGRWAHIICAILLPDTTFDDVILKEPINVSKLTENQNRLRLKCKYCLISVSNDPNTSRACIQCLSGKCFIPFHVTCGHLAGVVYEATNWPDQINVMCTKHRRKRQKRNFTKINLGDKVYAKHKRNKRYYTVTVKDIYNQEYCSVLFSDDNSTSTNMLPEDIVSRQKTTSGRPDIDEKITVKWTDEKIYNAIYKGYRTSELYTIEFEDGWSDTMERGELYSFDEKIPADVVSKLSRSTERQDFFRSKTHGKRPRIVNTKYSEDE